MNATFVLSLLLAVPLGITANILYAMIKPWWDNRTEQRRHRVIRKLEAQLKLLKRDEEKPRVDSSAVAEVPTENGSTPAFVSAPAPIRAGHSSPVEQLFESSDRWTTVVYTCRAAFTREECVPVGPIKKALWTHVPIDEVQSVCVAINHLMPAELRAHEDDILHTVMCSKSAEAILFGSIDENGLASSIPPLHERDLIIVGQNNLSDLLLAMVRCYLPWHAETGQRGPWGKPPRPDVYMELVPRFDHREFGVRELRKGAGMIALIPSPLNVRKRVLILFGCHREGQFALEDWLRGDEVAEVVKEIQKEDNRGTNAIQIAVDRVLAPPSGIRRAATVEALSNRRTNMRFWSTRFSDKQIGDQAVVNMSCSDQHELYDISLVVQLPSDTKDKLVGLATEVRKIPDLYWENERCDIGFHITLFEFFTHHQPPPHLRHHLELMKSQLTDAFAKAAASESPGGITARVRGFEFLPTAVVSYVDFLDETGTCCAWLDGVRGWCESNVKRAGLNEISANGLNAMRIPFPVHITLCRFNRKLQEDEQASLRRIAERTRNLELTRFPLKSASLAVATKAPYRDVSIAGTFQL